MLQQTFKFQKDFCDSTFTIATSVQENCESILKNSFDLYPWLPKEGKEAYMYWSEQCWLNLKQFKKASLSNLDYFEKIVAPAVKEEKKTQVPKPKAKPAAQPAAVKAKAPAKKATTPKRTRKPKTTAVSSTVKKAALAKKTAPTAKTETVQKAQPSADAGLKKA